MKEPYQRCHPILDQIIYGDVSTEEKIQKIEKAKYKDFEKYREEFAQNLTTEWLITGHLEEG